MGHRVYGSIDYTIVCKGGRINYNVDGGGRGGGGGTKCSQNQRFGKVEHLSVNINFKSF